MKILHVDSAKSWRGGENQVLMLSLGLKSRGHQVTIACPPNSKLAESSINAGIDVKHIPMRGEFDIAAGFRLARLIRKEGFDVAHLHTAHAHSSGLVASKLTQIPLILSRRVDFHIRRNPLSRYKYNEVDKIIAVSDGVKRVLIEDKIPLEKITVVHSGIDLKRFEDVGDLGYLYHEFRLNKKKRIVGIVAALAPHKDHNNFLRAAKIVSQAISATKFLIVGEGQEERRLKKLTTELGLDGTAIFTGFRKDIPNILAILDVFVLSSYLEGLCTSLLDAMASGLPIVATRTGGVPELIRDMENGILVPPREPGALAQGILKLFCNPVLAKSLGQAAQRTARDFSVEQMVEKTEQLYCSLLTANTTK